MVQNRKKKEAIITQRLKEHEATLWTGPHVKPENPNRAGVKLLNKLFMNTEKSNLGKPVY